MKNSLALFAATLCLFLTACHRPVAYFQPMPRPVIDRMPREQPTIAADHTTSDSIANEPLAMAVAPEVMAASASLKRSADVPVQTVIERRARRIQSLLAEPVKTTDRQPEPKKKLKLGNRIRQSLGMPIRKELNWWQRISWKLKASIIVLLVAVLFAILQITILAIIFGVVGAFLMISGLKRSFKVRRPWF